MKKILLSLVIFTVCLWLLASCGCGETTTTNSEGSKLPDPTPESTLVTTGESGEETSPATAAATKPTTKPKDSSNTPSDSTTPSSTQTPTLPDYPSNLCLNDLDKMAIKLLAFEKPDAFSGDVGITYVFNDNAADLDQRLLDGMQNKTVSLALRINGTLYPITDYVRSGVYLSLNAEKAGAMFVAGVAYSVALEFYDTNDSLICYSRSELVATPFSTKKTPKRKPLTVTLPTEGLNKVTINQNSLSTVGFEIWADSSVANLFDGNTRTRFGATAQVTVPTVFFNLSQNETLTYYTVHTASDAAMYPERNPLGWRLYGKIGDMWMLLSKVEDTATEETGLKAENETGFSYAIAAPFACSEYKIEFVFSSPMVQLGDITLYATKGFSAPAPDPNEGSVLNNSQAILSSFRLISELQNRVGVVYYLPTGSTVGNAIRAGLDRGEMFATVTLDKTVYQIIDHVWNGDYLYLDLQSAGAPVFANVIYQVSLGIHKASGTRLYYTNAQSLSSPYETPNLPERIGMNITLPQGLTQVSVNTNSVKTENIEHFGDGDPKQLFDGDTKNSKIGGTLAEGTFTLTFSLRSQAALTYYTVYTGNDTQSHPERNPLGWQLFGKVGEEYVLLSDIRETGVAYSGLEGVNATPYSYKIETPIACKEYMIIFDTNSMFQLNEMILYTGTGK